MADRDKMHISRLPRPGVVDAPARRRLAVMRFAFKTAPQNTNWADMLAVWKRGTTSRSSSPGGHSTTSTPSFLTVRSVHGGLDHPDRLGPGHTRVRLGTLVTGIHYRHPAVLANMASTLDIISGGRLELGIGAGWNEQESGAYGIELGTPRQRSDRFEEACEVILGLLTPRNHDVQG